MKKNEDVIRALEDSVAHWKRMREQAVKFDPCERPRIEEMNEAINEDWYGGHCALCELFFDHEGVDCYGCPLFNNSSSWSEWIENADRMIERLEELLEKLVDESAD